MCEAFLFYFLDQRLSRKSNKSKCSLRFVAEFLACLLSTRMWRCLEIFNHGLGDTSAAVRSASWLALSTREGSDGHEGADRMDVDTLAKGNAPSWVRWVLVLDTSSSWCKFYHNMFIIELYLYINPVASKVVEYHGFMFHCHSSDVEISRTLKQ